MKGRYCLLELIVYRKRSQAFLPQTCATDPGSDVCTSAQHRCLQLAVLAQGSLHLATLQSHCGHQKSGLMAYMSNHQVSLTLQVITAELNHVVVELLQQLLFWQERAKAQDPLKAAKRKRLVSGLRWVWMPQGFDLIGILQSEQWVACFMEQ